MLAAAAGCVLASAIAVAAVVLLSQAGVLGIDSLRAVTVAAAIAPLLGAIAGVMILATSKRP